MVFADQVYFSGGIWPSDGVFLHALEAATGKVVWTNTETGGVRMAQPHGGAEAASGVSPQGYLLATDTSLIVPTGRAVPAMFERGNGKLRYYHLQKNQQRGGTRVMLAEGSFVNAGCLFDVATGDLKSQLGMGPVVAIPGGVVRGEGRSLATYRWKDVQKIDRKGVSFAARVLEQENVAPLEREVLEFIITGVDAVVGCDGLITAIDYNTQRNQWWKHEVEGRVLGLAAGNGRVVATTDRGGVYLFDGDPAAAPKATTKIEEERPLDATALAEAKAVLDAGGIRAGCAVVLDAGHADFALALARQSDLQIIAVETDEGTATAARLRQAKAGLYGTRVAVQVGSLEDTGFPKQFANLVVAPRTVSPAVQKELERLRRPYGGVICYREDGRPRIEKSTAPAGAGSWTHQNSNAANTLCSDDEIVRGKLSMFWFRDVEFEVPNRHGQGPAPWFRRVT